MKFKSFFRLDVGPSRWVVWLHERKLLLHKISHNTRRVRPESNRQSNMWWLRCDAICVISQLNAIIFLWASITIEKLSIWIRAVCCWIFWMNCAAYRDISFITLNKWRRKDKKQINICCLLAVLTVQMTEIFSLVVILRRKK